MFSSFESLLLTQIHNLPLEIFVFIASFIEEVFAPIPSVAVLLLTGSFASMQERTLVELIPLAFIAALGKTLGALVVYYLTGTIGRMIVVKFGKFFEITPESIQEFGKKITNTPRDYFLLITLRALPIVPSAVVSVGSGLLKIPLPIFIVSTLVGSLLRDMVFLYIGFTGTELFSTHVDNMSNIESWLQALVIGTASAILAYLYFRRKKRGAIDIVD